MTPAGAAPAGSRTAARPGAHVFLVGMMGSGKSTAGRALAELLRRDFADLDAEVERAAGRPVADIFARAGEEAFRAAERDALATWSERARPAVLSVGGGAVLDPANRALLRAAGQVVWLRARPETLLERVGDGRGRPLLAGDPAAVLARLAQERRPLYEQACGGVAVDVDGLTPEQVAREVAGRLLWRVPVELGERSHQVVVGPGAAAGLAAALPPGARRAVVVTQPGIPFTVDTGLPTSWVEIGSGERAKSLRTVERCCRSFVEAGLTRADVVVGLGGGMVTDVAGFAASCYHRGTPVVQVSTTLLGQVDAAIGGKTGVNLPEGKNLVGAFWQPRAVFCDTDALATLPEREWRSGLGEMAKYAFLGVEELDRLPLAEQVARCAAAKAAVVAADEREGDARMLLNYGHTLAHALEALDLGEGGAPEGDDGAAGGSSGSGESGPPVDLRHGEAVAVGLVFAARLAAQLGRIGEDRVARHLEVVRGYGLPEAIPAGVPAGRLVELMARDKKASAGRTFVLDGPRGVEVVRDVPEAALLAALAASGAC